METDNNGTQILDNMLNESDSNHKYEIFDKLMKENELLIERYIEAENFIRNLNWFEKLFCSRKISNFLKSRIKALV